MARILVADDDDLLREFLKIRLAACGHSVIEAADGIAALDLIVSEPLDLILMDDGMPSLSGREVLGQIRSLVQINTAIIMMSRIAPSNITAKQGAQATEKWVQKPICADELIALIEACCNRPAATRIASQKLPFKLASAALAVATMSVPAYAQLPDTDFVSVGPSDPEPASDILTFGASHQTSWISRGAQPQWQDTQISAEYALHRTALYTAELSRSARFGAVDHHIALRGDWRIARNASVYLGLATSPEGNFREKWSMRAGGALGLGKGFELLADTRVAHYTSGTKVSFNPQLGVSSADERIAMTAGWINLWESGGKHYQGWSARLRLTPHDRLRIFAGAARYPEIETGLTRTVSSAFAGLSFKLSPKIELSASYARDRYESAFLRQALTFGLRWKIGNDP